MEELENLVKEYQGIIRCKKRFKIISKEIELEKKKLKELDIHVQEELSDIHYLEKSPLHSLFIRILKSQQEQFEKEKQEYLLAVLNYRECENLLELLGYERKVLEEKMQDEKVILESIDRAINKIPDEALKANSSFLSELKSINQELKKILQLKVELEEAIHVIEDLEKNFNSMINYINEAQSDNNWGKFYSEIQKAKAKRLEDIDKAHEHAFLVKKLLIFLQDELIDVIEVHEYFKRTDTLIRSFNINYYNDLINDWIKDQNLLETLSTTVTAHSTIVELKSSLNKIKDNAKAEFLIQELKKERLIKKISTT